MEVAADGQPFDGLTIEEKIEYVQDLWDTIADEAASVALTPAQDAELDRRLAAIDARDDRGEPWAIVRERIRAKR